MTSTRPTMISVRFAAPRHPSIAFPARIQPPPPNDISRKTITQRIRLWARSAPGRWIIATNRNIMIPKSRPDQRAATPVAMLKDAAINAKPTNKPRTNARACSPARCR